VIAVFSRVPLYLYKRSIRTVLTTAVVAAVTLGSGACSGVGGAGTDQTSDNEAIKVGVLLPYTGPFGLYGKPMEAALRARFAKAGDAVDGRKIELIFEDEATDAGTAVTKVTKLVDSDGVVAVICCATGAATLAVGPILAERAIPQLGPIPNPAGLEKFSTAAVAAPTAGHDAKKLGKHAASKLGHRTAIILASDFSYGREVAEGFKAGFAEGGGTVSGQTFAPLGAQDFGSYLSGIGTADVVFAGFAGADAVRFVQQYQQFGVKARMPLIGHGPLLTELVLQQIGEPAVDVGAGFYYSSSLDNAANKEFIAALAERDKALLPSHFTAGAWATGGVLLDAIARTEDVSDGKDFAKAIRATKLEAPWGPLAFDAKTGYAVAPTYYYTATRDGNALRHKVVEEIR
jgi:branched-chain amino acid transport system substrate-binding protein